MLSLRIRCSSISADVADDSSGYNPPDFVLDAAKEALNRVDANQYSPTKVVVKPVFILKLD